MRILAIAVAVAAAACVTQPLRVQPRTLADHATALTATGRAEVPVIEGGTAIAHADTAVEVWVPRGRDVGRDRCLALPILGRTCATRRRRIGGPDEKTRVTLRELVAACPGPRCLATRVSEDGGPVVIGRRRRVDPYAVAHLLGAAMALGLSAYCLAACEDAGEQFALAGGVVGGLLLIQPIGVLAK